MHFSNFCLFFSLSSSSSSRFRFFPDMCAYCLLKESNMLFFLFWRRRYFLARCLQAYILRMRGIKNSPKMFIYLFAILGLMISKCGWNETGCPPALTRPHSNRTGPSLSQARENTRKKTMNYTTPSIARMPKSPKSPRKTKSGKSRCSGGGSGKKIIWHRKVENPGQLCCFCRVDMGVSSSQCCGRLGCRFEIHYYV